MRDDEAICLQNIVIFRLADSAGLFFSDPLLSSRGAIIYRVNPFLEQTGAISLSPSATTGMLYVLNIMK